MEPGGCSFSLSSLCHEKHDMVEFKNIKVQIETVCIKGVAVSQLDRKTMGGIQKEKSKLWDVVHMVYDREG